MPAQELFNLTEYAKQAVKEIDELERKYLKERGEADVNSGTDRRT